MKSFIIIDNKGELVDILNIERPEQELADKYIKETDIVLELGARFGSVSCVIESKLNDGKNLVVVEPDEKVWDALETNRKKNQCEFHIIKGFVSNKSFELEGGGYGVTFNKNKMSDIPSISLNDVQNKYNKKFNVLVADCEGFLEEFFDQYPWFYDQLRKILFEADYPEKCNYKKITDTLKEKGFIEELCGHQNVWIKK